MRPKRLAAQKSQQRMKQVDEDMEFSDEESDGDFSSASSDEFDPKTQASSKDAKIEDTEDESDDLSEEVASEEEEDEEESFITSIKEKSRKSNGTNRNTVSTQRNNTINKLKSKQRSTANKHLQNILKKAAFKRPKTSILYDSDEDGSDDENVREKTPEFDCNGGMNLSDSESENDLPKQQTSKTKILKSNHETNSINEAALQLPTIDLQSIHDNLQKMKSFKEKLTNYGGGSTSKGGSQKENENIADLLAMGENSTVKKANASQKRPKTSQQDDSDSDNWEEVEENESIPKQDVEIFLNEFDGEKSDKKPSKPVDVEAQLKRKFNRKRKEYQEHLHKVELMCWITHCAFVNKRLNDTNLMNGALQLLPEKNRQQCYPQDKTDISYFKQITKWFKSTIKLKNTKMYCEGLTKRPPLMMSLAIQMKYKAAICRRDYVLIYIILLRALGIQCRMVQSIVCDPKICPKSELMSLSMKPVSAKKAQLKKKLMEIPQMDGADDLLDERKRSRRPLKLKGSSSFQVNESYIDIKKDDIKSVSKQSSENFSPKVKLGLDSPNRIQKSISMKNLDKLKVSPRKTRSQSKEQSPSVANRQISKKKADEKPLLQIVSPRRLRSRSTEPAEQKPPKKESSETKPNLKALSQKSSSTALKDKKKESLQVSSTPIARRLRSRSQSTDDKSEMKNEPSTSSSRKRESIIKNHIETKKPKLSKSKNDIEVKSPENSKKNPKKSKSSNSKDETKEKSSNSRKRPAIAEQEEQAVSSKKSKKLKEEHTESSDDSSLKYFKTNSFNNSKLNSSVSKASTSKASKSKSKTSSRSKSPIDNRVISTDSDDETLVRKSKGVDIWVEVYSEKDEKWIAINVFAEQIDNARAISSNATKPLQYVFAWNNDNSVKDISARYCIDFTTKVRKMRVERDYLSSILNIYPGTRTSRDLKEDDELNKVLYREPKPTSIADFKNHPLYALKRHLLKFQAIYPPEPPILGYIRDEAIYPRECVFTLHSRESWVKEARVVKLHEKPYKMSKTMKYDRVKNKLIRDVPLELFGIWQTKDYEPERAENGMVPRNGYGNVELFKECMLPYGTVHLRLPGLGKVCKKLGIDCAQAVVGFDSQGGWPYPVYDGFVVCKEFEDKVVDAWNREQEEIERKEQEKIEKRVYGNWKKLIKGLLIRERLMLKYNFNNKPK